MPSPRPLPTLLLLAALAYACGPRSRSDAATGNRAVSGPELASALKVSVDGSVNFSFAVTNNSARRMEFIFPSGQTVEFVVTDTVGRPVWRWSEGRVFTQALRSRVLESEEGFTHDANWRPGDLRGTFVAVASLRSENRPLEQSVRFSLP